MIKHKHRKSHFGGLTNITTSLLLSTKCYKKMQICFLLIHPCLVSFIHWQFAEHSCGYNRQLDTSSQSTLYLHGHIRHSNLKPSSKNFL